MIRARTANGERIELAPDASLTLAQRLFLAGLFGEVPLCAGLGKCGLCRVRFENAPPPLPEDLRRLGSAAVEAGWRLSCLRPAQSCAVELPPVRRAGAVKGKPAAHGPALLAVDLGTTSVHWAARVRGETVACGRGLNPQMGLGSEVMSRLAFAARPGGDEILRDLALERLRTILREAGDVSRLCVAGNSVMTYLLLGEPAVGLARAPYRLGYAGGDDRELAPDLPPARIPPLLAPFVGGDISAGMTALAFGPEPPEYPHLLADLGTNGEFALALSPDEYLLASVPMGPALEGVGLRHGRTAAPGAVRAFALTPAGLAPQYVERPPTPGEDAGVTGVGYLSLAAALLRAGALDETGRFVVPATPLGRRIAAGLAAGAGTEADAEATLPLPGGMLLPASDVEELVKVKAAFNLALSRLLAESGLPGRALRAVYLAGAMGEHVDARDLATLGFLPADLTGRVVRSGNTSLAGAALLLENPAAWDWARALPGRCRALDLANDPRFGALYVERMVLRHVP